MKYEIKNNLIQLTFCTNIFKSASWEECFSELKKNLPQITQTYQIPFGIGLKLSNQEVEELLIPHNTKEFNQWLNDNNYYISTINAFAYGEFHGKNNKANIYEPDWTTEKRILYTKNIIELISKLDSKSKNIPISTVPLGFKPNFSKTEVSTAALNLIHMAQHIDSINKATHKKIILALEPEPACFLETSKDIKEFFSDYLFNSAFYLDQNLSPELILLVKEHIGICVDTCHFSVMFNDRVDNIKTILNLGIRIPKVQLSSGLVFSGTEQEFYNIIKDFDDKIFLHQYSKKTASKITHFLDLPNNFEQSSHRSEYRVHFHVPLFENNYGVLSGTQEFTKEVIHLFTHECKQDMIFEVETYTFSVLPKKYLNLSLNESIKKELDWVKKTLNIL